ncbi:hypothetical protein GTA08_BOTSDO09975 [Botryosphaeria dothidea]|uniref:Uncharacterized protein n=1 Tax=Botryosphaeria dothidea TaxID=55169 RepID=A0A8H4MYV2_9PEZI|nr:hypothetical protein GTA08_BOTSDO09975 [Botryosphaeria dothidea]
MSTSNSSATSKKSSQASLLPVPKMEASPSFTSTSQFLPAMNHGQANLQSVDEKGPGSTQSKSNKILDSSKRLFYRIKEIARGNCTPNNHLTPAFDIVDTAGDKAADSSHSSPSSAFSKDWRSRANSDASRDTGYFNTAASSLYDFEYAEHGRSPTDVQFRKPSSQRLQVPSPTPVKKPRRRDPIEEVQEEATKEEAVERAQVLARSNSNGDFGPGNPLARRREDQRGTKTLRLSKQLVRRQ